MSNLQKDRERQKIITATDKNLEYCCKVVIPEYIPFLKGSISSDPESEGRALANLEPERPKFLEVARIGLKKSQFQDVIYLAENLAIFYERRSYLDELVEVSTYALEAAISMKDLSSEAYMLGTLGRVFRIQNCWTKAIDNCQKSISIYESLNESLKHDDALKIAKADILDVLGNIYRSHGSLKDLENAEQQFTESIRLFHEAGDLIGELKAWDGLAQVYIKQKKLELAKNILEETLKRKRESRDTNFSISVTLNNLGKILRDMELFDQAELIFEEALKMKKELLDWRGEATTYNELGILKKRVGNVADAFKIFNLSLEIKREGKDDHGQGLSLFEIGTLYSELGEKIQACESWIQALANLTKESEQYRRNEKLLIQEALDSIDFKELSDSSLKILEKIEINPLQNKELKELLSLQDARELSSDERIQLEILIKICDLCLLRKSQALNEIERRNLGN